MKLEKLILSTLASITLIGSAYAQEPPKEPYIEIVVKENKLYYHSDSTYVYSVATGRKKGFTPLGEYSIVSKKIRPGGPYGSRWMGLGRNGLGIHGTNNESSIGKYASHGCIRMHKADVESLYTKVEIGTKVIIK